MIDEKTKERIRKLGLQVSEFQINEVNSNERIRNLEDAVIELADLIVSEE